MQDKWVLNIIDFRGKEYINTLLSLILHRLSLINHFNGCQSVQLDVHISNRKKMKTGY